jgi:hypothetical protein
MRLDLTHSSATRLIFLLCLLAGLGMWMAAAQTFQAGAAGTPSPTETRATRTKKPERQPPPAVLIPRLCGKLVFITEAETGLVRAALRTCSQGKIYIFAVNPREVVPYYQFRDAVIASGPRFLSNEYGVLDLYITTFKNFVGIDSCSQCGEYMPPPTWTHAPLTPYTSTPLPPTRTLYVPSPTATATVTLAPWEVTETPGMFELLYGTNIPSSSPAGTTTIQVSPTFGQTPTEDVAIEKKNPLTSPLVVFIGLLLVSILLTYLVYIRTVRSR